MKLFKGHALFIYNHKSLQKCVEGMRFLSMDVTAVLQEIAQNHHQQGVLLDAL